MCQAVKRRVIPNGGSNNLINNLKINKVGHQMRAAVY